MKAGRRMGNAAVTGAALVLWLGAAAATAQDCERYDGFDEGIDGWTPVDPSEVEIFWYHDGNPDGCLYTRDANPGAADVRAPARFAGNLSGLDGAGIVRLDHKFLYCEDSRPPVGDPRIILIGPGGRATCVFGGPTDPGVWYEYELPFVPASFTVSEGSWSALVANVTEVWVDLEVTTGHDHNLADNFYIGLPPQPGNDYDGNRIPDTCMPCPVVSSVTAEPWESYGQAFVIPGNMIAEDDLVVTVLDQTGSPMEGLLVQIAFDGCGDICIDEGNPYLEAVTDESGNAYLNPSVGGADYCTVDVRVRGETWLSFPRVVGPDFDSIGPNGRVDSADEQAFLSYMWSGFDLADYDGDGVVGPFEEGVFYACLDVARNEQPCNLQDPSCARFADFTHPDHEWTPDDAGPGTPSLVWHEDGGRPWGTLEAVNADGGFGDAEIVSPSGWAGDAYGLTGYGEVRFDLMIPDDVPGPVMIPPAVTLLGGSIAGGRADYIFEELPLPGIWMSYSVALDASLWLTDGPLLVAILQDLAEVRIGCDLADGPDRILFDNVYVGRSLDEELDADANGLPDACQPENFDLVLGNCNPAMGRFFAMPGVTSKAYDIPVSVKDGYGDARAKVSVEARLTEPCPDLCMAPVQPRLTTVTGSGGGGGLDPDMGGCGACPIDVVMDHLLVYHFDQVVSPDFDGSEGNGWINHRDYAYFQSVFGYGIYDGCADYTSDGMVDLGDLTLMVAALGTYGTTICDGSDPLSCNRASCFHFGSENWTGYPPGQTIVQYLATGGNPDGHLRCFNFGSEEAYITAPLNFCGDWTDLDGSGVVRFDHDLANDGGAPVAAPMKIVLIGAGGTAEHVFPTLPEPGVWTTYAADLEASSWTVTAGTWPALLADVQAVMLLTEFTPSFDQNLFDNIYVGPRLDYYGDGNRNLMPDACEMAPTSARETPPNRGDLTLDNFPNPFNPSTTIVYSLPADGKVDLSVYDIRGRLVKTLTRGELRAAGIGNATWRGDDEQGRPVAGGVYLVRLQANGRVATLRVAVIK